MKEADVKLLYQANFDAFVRLASRELRIDPRLYGGWHVDVMSDFLSRTYEGKIPRLIINGPPSSQISFYASVALPVWALGLNPALKILVISGNRELAVDLHRRARALMQTSRVRQLFPNLRFNTARPEIHLAQGGYLMSGFVGHSRIGRDADIIIIDDPLSPTQARDPRSRKAVNDWIDSEIVPRLNDKSSGIVILVMQRQHPEDPAGHLLDRNDKWTHVNLPAIALEDETWQLSNGAVYTRRKGEVLNPAWESRDRLRAILSELSATSFSAQYLQRPFIPQYPDEHRKGWHTERIDPETWTPEDGCPPGAFRNVSEKRYLLYEVFGEGERPPDFNQDNGLTRDQWQQACTLQQRRLQALMDATE